MIARNHMVSVRRGFLFLLVRMISCVILLGHFMNLSRYDQASALGQ